MAFEEMRLAELSTPAAIIDTERMQRNLQRMQGRMDKLGVTFRPHVKTTKCLDVVRQQIAAGAKGITVSTLKEAEQCFTAGVSDILYAVGMVASKLRQAEALISRGCHLKIIADSAESATAIAVYSHAHQTPFEVWIEIDSDGHRSGVNPMSDDLLEIGRLLHSGHGKLAGVLTHAGSSYELNTPKSLEALAEQERQLCVLAATRLRMAGLPCPNVSVGSTPTALSSASLEGVTEVRAGVYVFFDLVMANVGVCTLDDIALSVLTTVIGHQKEKGWVIVDAGWMAMSRDRGTQKQGADYGYGQICDVSGKPLHGYLMTSANQEHGIVSATSGAISSVDLDIAKRFPIGTQLRVLPNHACATGAQFPAYYALMTHHDRETCKAHEWPRFYGW